MWWFFPLVKFEGLPFRVADREAIWVGAGQLNVSLCPLLAAKVVCAFGLSPGAAARRITPAASLNAAFGQVKSSDGRDRETRARPGRRQDCPHRAAEDTASGAGRQLGQAILTAEPSPASAGGEGDSGCV
ncbi:hypothetical protein MAPG_03434 [Magnaporthiopsis poae ATCC 64411]|uniref:Uncharacterized protein n=1 Tax=Magnaporthiopsis poae (strain ATCC 64411 / 73-15) TaxID=644358 RepID=A0A0C4DU03_MAGP6|nr:hypothetical protein MAPG_03434 [Magnaporthiopsis poae ATCC 64411]